MNNLTYFFNSGPRTTCGGSFFTLVTHQTMNEMEGMLPARQFIRVHRSWLVAIRHIRAIYGNSIELGKVTIPIGVNYKEMVMVLVGKK